jgi:serine/threonine protein kinase
MHVPGEEPFVKLLDFGISKRAGASSGLTGEFDILGTPDYMAPEQASGRTAHVDHRGDQFALAVIAYQMLTGMLPFAGSNVMEILRRVLNDTPCPASEIDETLPKAMDDVFARALSKDPADRFESIGLFAQELASAAGYFPLVRASLVPLVAERRGGTPTPSAALPGSASADQLARRATTRVTHIPPQVATATPITGTRKKSGGPPRSSLTADAVSDYLDQARQALDEDDAEAAVSHAEQALDLANSSDCAIALKSVHSSETLLARIFERRLGQLTRSVKINLSGNGAQLSPQHAFLLSRLEGGVTFEEALDLTPLPRPQALRQLVQLLRAGLIQAS